MYYVIAAEFQKSTEALFSNLYMSVFRVCPENYIIITDLFSLSKQTFSRKGDLLHSIMIKQYMTFFVLEERHKITNLNMKIFISKRV